MRNWGIIRDIDLTKSYLHNPSLFPHGMSGIGAKIRQHLVDLGGICLDGPDVRFYLLSDFDGAG